MWLNGLEPQGVVSLTPERALALWRWIFGSGPVPQGVFSGPVSGRSFHPTGAGHRGYAALLERYMDQAVLRAGAAGLTSAGLPPNPRPDVSRSRLAQGSRRRSAGGGAESSETLKQASGPGADGTGAGPAVSRVPIVVTGVSVRRCAGDVVVSGDLVAFAAVGFESDARVKFAAAGVTLAGTALARQDLPAATADSDGRVEIRWSVPGWTDDSAPRLYSVVAAGPAADGGLAAASMLLPLIAYPVSAPCASDDAAATTLGRPVRIAVLANDTAPGGGALVAGSVRAEAVPGGRFEHDASDGSLTFAPDAGFAGTVSTRYLVADSNGAVFAATVTVTVDAGCTVTGAPGTVEISGTDGDDVICVPDPDDADAFHVIDAKAGNDIVLGGAGHDWVYGGAGDDTIYGRAGDDRIVAGAGIDTVHGGAGIDRVYSSDLDDTVVDTRGGYELVVSPAARVAQSAPAATVDWQHMDVSDTAILDVLGNDHDANGDLRPASLRIGRQPVSGAARVVDGQAGARLVEFASAGASGADSFSYEVCDALGQCATAEVTVMVGTAECTIIGTEGDDTIRGTPGADVICGLGGDDTIRGIGGDDVIIGGSGDDEVDGGDGADRIWGGIGADTLHGGPGADEIWGGAGDDSLWSNTGADRLFGGDGDDTAIGGGGDLIWGGAGDDDLNGHAGDDTLWGGPGADMLRGGNGHDALWGNAGADRLHGGAGDDSLDGAIQNDALWGGPGDDTLDGQGHDDQLEGGTGHDLLRGGAGDDRIWGGAGNDDLDGGNGTDHLDGGNGTDTCRRAHSDTGCETRVSR